MNRDHPQRARDRKKPGLSRALGSLVLAATERRGFPVEICDDIVGAGEQFPAIVKEKFSRLGEG